MTRVVSDRNPLIEEFVRAYERELDFYTTVATLAGEELETTLIESGIRAIVTARAKRPDSLRKKLYGRKRRFEDIQQIRDDIVDLAGARVALYFPAQRSMVGSLIASSFRVAKTIDFPREATGSLFPGYIATHHRAQLREEHVLPEQKRYCTAMIEIQVASVLMHAWAEVEHDLAYKPSSGDLSPEERQILDSLNALVLSGDTSLELLQRAVERRVRNETRRFRDQYDLATLLSENPSNVLYPDDEQTSPTMDSLLDLLRALDLDTPGALSPILIAVAPKRGPLAERIIGQVIGQDKKRLRIYEEIRRRKKPESDASGELSKRFQRLMNTLIRRARSAPNDAKLQSLLGEFRSLHNLSVQGRVALDPEVLQGAMHRLRSELDRGGRLRREPK